MDPERRQRLFSSWVRQHPFGYAVAAGGLTLIAGWSIFGDVRPGLGGGAFAGLFIYWIWRDGGLAWRVDDRQREQLEARGERPRLWWVAAASASVVVALIVSALFLALILDRL